MSRLYCPECAEYLMAGDGECHDCSCGWCQPVDRDDENEEVDDECDRAV